MLTYCLRKEVASASGACQSVRLSAYGLGFAHTAVKCRDIKIDPAVSPSP